MPLRDVKSWTSMIAGYARRGHGEDALKLFWQMQEESVKPDHFTFVSALQACASLAALEQGKQIHTCIIQSGFESDVMLASSLVDMYSKCGSIEYAQQVFDKMPIRDVVLWTTMVAGYSRQGHREEVLRLFHRMQNDRVKPNQVTFVSILKACASPGALDQGKHIHAHVIKSGFESDGFVGNTLVDMYAKCGSIKEARRIFNKMHKRDVVSWTAMVAGYCRHGQCDEALKLFWQMQGESVKPNRFTFISVLKSCAGLAVLEQGKQIHAHMIETGFGSDAFLGSSLVDMYAKCGSIDHAREVFDKFSERDVVSWTSMISGYARYGHGKEALNLFWQMQREGVKPNRVTFIGALKACSSIAAIGAGKLIHAYIIKSGFDLDIHLGNILIDMYSKCGKIEDARQVFDKMARQDMISWTAMVAGYVQHGDGEEALKLFQQLQEEIVMPDQGTFSSVLKACACLGALEKGKQVHAHLIKSGFELDVLVGNALIDMYAKCGETEYAHRIFNKLPKRDVISWNAMAAGCAQNGYGVGALKLFWQMQEENVQPDRVTFVSILKACAGLGVLELGKHIHSEIIKTGFETDPFVGSSLVDMYAKCGSIEHARQVFDKMPKHDVVSWTAMIAGYAEHGHADEALKLFWQMELESVKPDQVIFVNILKCCDDLALLDQGRLIHFSTIKNGFDSDFVVGSALVDMYAKCGSIEHARQVFEKIPKLDVGSWNALIAGYVQHDHSEMALELFWQMQGESLKPDQGTFVSILKACASLANLEEGKQIHAHIIKCELELNVFVGNKLIDMYTKCGGMEHARQVFEKMPKENVISWNVMAAGYARHGHPEEVLKLYWQMQMENVRPDQVTFVTILRACTSLSALEEGKQIHVHAIDTGFVSDASVASTLVDMYAKCGSIEQARQLFDKMSRRDMVSWTAMISGYAQHGYGKEALKLVEEMNQECVELDHITFTCVLSACNHAGLVDEGRHYFHSMNREHGISPAAEHYACMVDLLGRAGCLGEVKDFVRKMPFHPSAVVWGALLGACRIHGHVELAEHATECVLELEPENAAAFVQLSNIYAVSSCWDDKARVRKLMEARGLKKQPGCTWIEVNKQVHSFIVDDTSHPQINEIHAELKRLSELMAKEGYIADTRFVLHGAEKKKKKAYLCYHSEKLAIAFGLISIPKGIPVRIIKNLRVCGDCHTASKFISRIVGREVIVRDANRFHHFKDGICSCGDYW